MAVIVGNRLRQVGNPEDVFAAPADEEVSQFVNHRTLANRQRQRSP
jgi:ABC-type proline/glycine betaine transport system ATPase subunit